MDSFEIPVGSIFHLKVSGKVHFEGNVAAYEFSENEVVQSEVIVSTFYPIDESHPLLETFKNVRIEKLDVEPYITVRYHCSDIYNVSFLAEQGLFCYSSWF